MSPDGYPALQYLQSVRVSNVLRQSGGLFPRGVCRHSIMKFEK